MDRVRETRFRVSENCMRPIRIGHSLELIGARGRGVPLKGTVISLNLLKAGILCSI